MGIDLMWLWWAITIAICSWKIIEGVFVPHRMLEWPFLACAMWAYFYGYMAYIAKTSLSEYLINDISNIGQLVPLLCLLGLLVGWALGTRKTKELSVAMRSYPYVRLWCAGFFFLMVGAAGGYSVMQEIQEGTLNYQATSGYWYLLFYVGYPGLAVTIWAVFKMDPKSRIYFLIITAIGLAAFMFPHVFRARRGPLFPAIMILLLVPPLARRRSPNPLVFGAGLVIAGVVMLLFLQIRAVTNMGGTWGDAMHNLSLNTATEERAKQPEDNEYINNCQLIATIYQNGKYQYGSGHLELLWHWVPHSWWRIKPSLGEGYYSFNEMFDDVEAAMGVRLLGTGAASAGAADSFVQYGLFCPFFWLILSWGMGLVYSRARVGGNPLWLFCYVGFICASHWLVSQSFAAAFVPGMCFQAVPLVIFLLFGQLFKKKATVRSRRRPLRYPSAPQAVQS